MELEVLSLKIFKLDIQKSSMLREKKTAALPASTDARQLGDRGTGILRDFADCKCAAQNTVLGEDT